MAHSVVSSILDSSLISATLPKIEYDTKIIVCGNYARVYKYSNTRVVSNKNYVKQDKNKSSQQQHALLSCCNTKIDEYDLYSINTKIDNKPTLKQIEKKNLVRSKNNMSNLILSNIEIFKTFITLTFNDDIKDIVQASHEFHNFVTEIRRVYSEFSYIGVPEFQKNDRVHYHLITNISYDNILLINENISIIKFSHINFKLYKFNHSKIKLNDDIKFNNFDICFRKQNNKWENTKKTYNYKTKSYKVFKTIKFWNNGFSSIMPLDLICGNNVAGYMSKYMTKDIDNRLFGKNRYLYSRNLKKPKERLLNSNDKADRIALEYLSDNSDIKYSNKYQDNFGNIYDFSESLLKNGFIDFINT